MHHRLTLDLHRWHQPDARELEKNRCTIAIIPHTVELTNLGSLKPGDPVNLEADVIAKYVEKMMRGEQQSSLTVEELVKQGF